MKVKINQDTLRDYRERNMPVTLTITSVNICFNNQARKLLALDKGTHFELEFEDGKLYYRDGSSADSDFQIAHVSDKMLGCNVGKIGDYISTFLGSKGSKHKFTIGDIKYGRRELIRL